MEDQFVFEQFHEAFDVEPGAGSFERLRSKLVAAETRTRRPAQPALRLPRGWLRFAAVVALIVLAVAWVAVFVAINANIHRSVPALPGPFKVRAPGVPVCAGSCQITAATFVSPSVGFILEAGGPEACASSCPPQAVYLYRTLDGGHNWTPVYSTFLDCCGSGRLVASADGKQLLVIGTKNGKTALASNSGGSGGWLSVGLPSANREVTQTICPPAYKPGPCSQERLDPQVYFIDPQHGWAVSQEQSFNIADLYETTNGGADWTLTSRIDLVSEFGLNLSTSTDLTVDHTLRGQFVFTGGSIAWFIPPGSTVPQLPSKAGRPDVGLHLFRSVDGGITWNSEPVAAPAGVTPGDGAAMSLKFFDSRRGVLELVVNPADGGLIVEKRFVYTTSDGGTSWSSPIAVPEPTLYESMRYLDPQNWVGWPYGGGLISTSDAGQHWHVITGKVGFGQAPADGAGLPPQMPADYPLRGQYGFVDLSHGWALAHQGTGDGLALFVTDDGGVDWHPVSLPELL